MKRCNAKMHKGKKLIPESEFYAAQRNENGEILRLQSYCKECSKIKRRNLKRQNRIEAGLPPTRTRMDRQRKLQKKRAANHDRRDPRLPFPEFQNWLRDKVEKSSCTEVARRVGVSDDRVRALVKGYTYKNKKRYETKHIRYSTIDKFMVPFGEFPTMIYPTGMISLYRVTQAKEDRRSRANKTDPSK